MALFPRRVLQRILDTSQSYFSSAEKQAFCNVLNKVSENYLATEWELVVVDAAAQVGSVQYEPDFGGGRRPDFLFRSESRLSFVADVTAVSDRGLHKQNPFEALQEEFWRQKRKMGILHSGFDVDVRGYPRNSYRGSGEKPRLKLPKISEFPTKIFNADFRAFMQSVRENPSVPLKYEIKQEDTVVTFLYHPARQDFGGGSHPAFDFAAVIDSNPVYNALSAKAEQLKGSGYNGIKGIFLCDAGCRILHDRSGDWASYPVEQIVWHFLRQHQSISFVAILTVESGNARRVSGVYIKARLYVSPKVGEERIELDGMVKRLASLLPRPEQSPVNAMNHLKGRNGMVGKHLGTLTGGGSIEMSARMLLEILAGRMTVQDFEREYGMKPDENPFRRMLVHGRLLKSVNVEVHSDKDDDRVILNFGERDAAVSPFSTK
jgi:hypothetical protein